LILEGFQPSEVVAVKDRSQRHGVVGVQSVTGFDTGVGGSQRHLSVVGVTAGWEPTPISKLRDPAVAVLIEDLIDAEKLDCRAEGIAQREAEEAAGE
jgi:hypothetical protein